MCRRLIGHTGISDAHSLNILRQYFCPGRMDLIAQKKPLPVKLCRQLGTLPSGSRTQIQHPVSGTNLQKLRRCHRTGLLNIVHPCLMVGVLAGLIPGLIIITVFSPGNGSQVCKQAPFPQTGSCPSAPVISLQCIQSERLVFRLIIGGQKSLIFSTQRLLHSVQKFLRKHSLSPSRALYSEPVTYSPDRLDIFRV